MAMAVHVLSIHGLWMDIPWNILASGKSKSLLFDMHRQHSHLKNLTQANPPVGVDFIFINVFLGIHQIAKCH